MDKVLVVRSADNADRFLGSAYLWGESAEVAVTAAHVVGKASEVRIVDRQGREELGTVIARDEVRDVALIALGPVFQGRAGLIPGPAAALGQPVWALGAPLGIDFTLTQGLVSASARQVSAAVPILMLQHDAAVNPGSSGGPLVDAEGRLVGMNVMIADGSRMFVGIAYAIPAAELDRIVTGLIEETLPPLPKLGLRARPVDRQLAEVLGVAPTGLLVDEVEAAGLAERAGLLPGDILVAVGGHPIDKPGDLPFALEAAQEAGSADLAVMRAGQMLLFTLPLEVAEEENLSLRDLAGAAPQKVRDYTLASLGIVLDATGTVTEVTVNSPANGAGLAVGDRILMVNGAEADPATLDKVVLTAPALLLLAGAGGTRHVLVDPYGTQTGIRPVGGANVLDPDVVVF